VTLIGKGYTEIAVYGQSVSGEEISTFCLTGLCSGSKSHPSSAARYGSRMLRIRWCSELSARAQILSDEDPGV